MPKINQEEYEIEETEMTKNKQEEYRALKSLSDYWEWIARDKTGRLYRFHEKPKKVNGFVWDNRNKTWTNMIGDDTLFQFIQWEDKEPHNIAELIEEYEIETGMRYDFGKIKVVDIDTSKLATKNGFFYVKESEETEVKKDLNWFKEKLEVLKTIDRRMWEKSEPNSKNQSHFNGSLATIDKVLDFLSQLDEPETLSQEWINNHTDKFVSSFDLRFVSTKDLQNLLLPKQEEIRVPEWFAKWFEGRGYEMSLYGIFNDLYTNNKSKMEEWSKQYEMGHTELQNDIASIKLHGKGIYEVEEEPKYIVRFNRGAYKPVFIALDKISNHIHYVESHDYNKENLRVHLNEWEIRALDDGDILFEHFATPVEELEE